MLMPITIFQPYAGNNFTTSLLIPTSVKRIGNYAFAYCHRLASAIISNSVTFLGQVRHKILTMSCFVQPIIGICLDFIHRVPSTRTARCSIIPSGPIQVKSLPQLDLHCKNLRSKFLRLISRIYLRTHFSIASYWQSLYHRKIKISRKCDCCFQLLLSYEFSFIAIGISA